MKSSPKKKRNNMAAAKTIAILGAGKLGTTLAKLALNAGYTVYIAGSGPVDKIALSIKILLPGAIATTSADAIAHADTVILALPLGKYRTLPADALKNKLVIDGMNYWWEVDGHEKELQHPTLSTSELVQKHLKGARVVKALSHMGYHHLHDETKPANAPGRKAIAIAADDANDTATVAKIIDDFGFDPVYIGPLATGKILEPHHELFGANIDKDTLTKIAKREIKSR